MSEYWRCSSCQTCNWASNKQCRYCSSAKPSSPARKAQGSKQKRNNMGSSLVPAQSRSGGSAGWHRHQEDPYHAWQQEQYPIES
eukprot:6263206-Alexandrium_andersonii.AAC.1